MSEEFKDMGQAPAAPVLTFGQEPAEEQERLDETVQAAQAAAAAVSNMAGAAAAAIPEAEMKTPVEDQLTENVLTEEEKKLVDDFSKKIDLHDTNGILTYGAGTQKKMADFSESALQNVQTKDLGEVGDMITGLVTELKNFDVDEKESKGLFGLFKKSENKLVTMKTKYDKVEVNVDKIVQALESHQVKLMKDVAVLDNMYELNLSYFKELSMYIIAGKKRLKEVRETELAELIKKAEESNLPEDAQAAKDMEDTCLRFEKKLHDLELTRMIAIQTAPQIRLVQSSDTMMIEKIQSTIMNTIPLWKSQMVIAMGVEHANQAAKAEQQVTDMTNELLKKNAEALHMATVETAKASERGIVDLDTLRQTNNTLISTLDEVLKIQAEGKQKRLEAEDELNRMEYELKNKLLEIKNR